MSTKETDSMASLISSLSQSFKRVHTAAVPAMLNCILASTGLSPSVLFASLLEDSPNLIKDAIKKDEKLDSDCCNYIASLVGSLCHLLKKFGDNRGEMQLFLWKFLIPLMKMVHLHDREILNQICRSFFDVVINTHTWDILETDFVPFLLQSIGPSLWTSHNEESDVIEWGRHLVSEVPNDLGSLPMPLSCHILTLTLETALQCMQPAQTTESMLVNGCCYVANFAATLLWNLCNMTERLLLQSLEHRSCTIGSLLPIICKAFASHRTFEKSIHGRTWILSRNSFFLKIWSCCKTLFSLGPLERRDAYNVLSLYLSFFSCIEIENAELGNRAEAFDIRSEKEFWNEIKRGLVDEEGYVRKQSLHILKSILCISEGSQCNLVVREKNPQDRHSVPRGMTKRDLWADKEAESLGVRKFCNSIESGLNSQQQWEAFLLLYEMLEEYGIHLVEAAWSHQATLLLQFSFANDSFVSAIRGAAHQNQMETLVEVFNWLSILWERGFRHDNPQVRCIIMQSFLSIEWKSYGSYAKAVPESFVLGPLMEGLNDPVHHKDFGVKGVYTSKAIEGAGRFLHHYTSYLSAREQISFLIKLASTAKKQSFGRAGLMGLAVCIASSACGVGKHDETKLCLDAFLDTLQVESPMKNSSDNDKVDLLDVLRFVIESSKQHFNPNYRLRVCEKVLEAAALLVSAWDVPLEILLHFISAIPREFTDYNGSLRVTIQEWLLGSDKNSSNNAHGDEKHLCKSLHDFLEGFTGHHCMVETFDDEDVDAWELQAKRWIRVLFLVISEEQDLAPMLMFIQNHGVNLCKGNSHFKRAPVKFLILTLSVVLEIQIMQEQTAKFGVRIKNKSDIGLLETMAPTVICEKFSEVFYNILEEMISFGNLSCSVFWSTIATEGTILPSSVRGKLGGPSQRRLSASTTSAVLQAIISMRAIASISSLCAEFKSEAELDFAITFLWKFFWETILYLSSDSETRAEVSLAAYEALAHVLKVLIPSFSPQASYLLWKNYKLLLPAVEGKSWLDSLVVSFLLNINNFLATGILARSRRAVLLNWKWLCLESLLSIPCNAFQSRVHRDDSGTFFSDTTLRCIFGDLVESLENAGEGSILPMLRSVRLVLGLFSPGRLSLVGSSCNGVDAQMMWRLVRSSLILHVSCNKRRIASIAALLSSVLHSSVFSDEDMHVTDQAPGPLKWFVEKLLEEGTKSPRTIRLAALHLTGLFLSNPSTIKYYIKELRLLTLYGSVAFDEDFESELSDNYDARTEVSLLGKSPAPELTEVFINTELYARVSVAALFYKLADLADMVGSANENQSCQPALESGKMFLLDLLDFVVHDKDLAKELYKKYSGIHRRKIRAWQMICVLSRFVHDDIVGQVTQSLHISIYRNNLPAVRQYLETFAINIYLKFPSLVGEQLVPILRDYDMKPQALSSYVFIAANVILHASKAVQSKHLDELLPSIIPLLTSHHHSLRGFTQLLVHHVLCKLFPPLDYGPSEPLEKRCFGDLKSYLEKNSDCKRLRLSMEGYLDAYDPNNSVTPAGIFVNRVEEIEFECVPVSLMDHVLSFLNDVREDLRLSMANDVVKIKTESLKIGEDPNCKKIFSVANDEKLLQQPKEALLDFQKKLTLSKHEKQDTSSSSLFKNRETYERLLEMETEDELLHQLLQSRSTEMERIKASRQDFILVASLLDRIPNLAGLARTCEVFKASGLAMADAKIVLDKQFQLISVTAEKWVPIIEVPVNSMTHFLEKKKREGFSILGLEQTANSVPLDQYIFPKKTVLVLGREKEGIPVDIIHILDACIEIPQLGVVRSLNVHVSGAIALWEYTRQQRSQ